MLLLATSALLFGAGALTSAVAFAACNSRSGPAATLPASQSPSIYPTATDTTITVKIGDTFDFGGLKIKVTEVVDPLSTTESAFIPLPGNRFVGIGFEVANPGGQSRTFSPPTDVNLIDRDGGRYQVVLGQRADDFLGQEVKPGVSSKGRFSFEMADPKAPASVEFRRTGVVGVNVSLGGG